MAEISLLGKAYQKQSEVHRQELEQELLKKDQQLAAFLAAETKVCSMYSL
jgi:hypothetical protein